MEIADLHLLIVAAEAGSFRKAAQKLGIDAATLSRRVARLEDELGVLLLERGTAGVRPTVAGSSTLSLARKAVADFEAIRLNAAANGKAEAGRIRLGTHLSTIGARLRSLLRRWRSQHPGVVLDLTEIDDRALLVGLRDRELSALVSFSPVLPSSLARETLWTERLSLALPTAHPLSSVPRLGWREVRSVPLLVRSWSGSNAYRELQARLVGPEAEFRPQAAGMFNLLNLVSIGEGAAIVMEYHREMAVDGVLLRPIDEPDAEIQVVLAWDPQVEDAIAGSFVALVRDHAKTV